MHKHLEPLPLPSIPLLDVEAGFPFETLERDQERAHALLDVATRGIPRVALHALDAISRRWLVRRRNAYLGEIDAIARRLDRPGAYFLSVSYEWGCTSAVGPAPDGQTARLVRVLDWATAGLGRYVVAARVRNANGPFVTLTWPGYTGVLQAMAPGRFAAALNMAPMRRPVGLYHVDWAANRVRVWRMSYPMPAHLLREVFEGAATFAEAKHSLIHRPIAAPAIFSLAGVAPGETAVIERTERRARVHDGAGCAANHWHSFGWQGHERGPDSLGRARHLSGRLPDFDPTFSWLAPPVLNGCTRLALIADAASARLMAQGFEESAPATRTLAIDPRRAPGQNLDSVRAPSLLHPHVAG